MKKPLNRMSDNELSETLNALHEAKNRLEQDYCHVSEYYPTVLKEINKQIDKYYIEERKRENEIQ